MKSLLIPAIIFAALTPSLLAQHQTLTLNPDASHVAITLNTTHEVVHGTFHLQSGTIDFDRSSPHLSGSILVLSATGETGNSSRDNRMKKSILLAAQHANISFAPTSYTGSLSATAPSTLQVTGIFTLLDTPHTLTIPILVQLNGLAATAKAHFEIPYIEWGVKDPSFLFWKADKSVVIDLDLSGQLSK